MASAHPRVGEVLSKYEILEEIGQGGMATVFRALDTSLNREVAVKILHAHLATRKESRDRFQREAHAVARLRHDNILEIFDYSGKDSEDNFIVMEFIHGPTLKELLDTVSLRIPEVGAMIVAEVCSALVHAHSSGIIHRDIKPENIMVRDDGVIKLTDFGIASMVDTQKLTVTGQLLGSPAFMAPEMVIGERLDFRTDVFSVGILLYRLAVGELPFKGKNPHEVLKRIAEVDYILPIIANPQVGDELSKIIDRAMARNPDDRFSSVEELRKTLTEYLARSQVEDGRQELKKFFKNPDEYQRDFELILIQNLVERARSELRRGNHARAMSLLNRVLSFDPHNQEVKGLLGRLSRRQGLRSLLKLALLLVLIAGAGLGVAWGIKTMRGSPGETPRTRGSDAGAALLAQGQGVDAGQGGGIRIADGGGAPRASGHGDAGARRSVGVDAGKTGPGGKLDAGARKVAMGTAWRSMHPPTSKPRVFALRVTPPTWTALLDGKPLGFPEGLPTSVSVPNDGRDHVISLVDRQRRFTVVYKITPRTKAGTVGNRWRVWRPATLTVVGTPTNAFARFTRPLWLARMGQRMMGQPFRISFKNQKKGVINASLRVHLPGFNHTDRQVTIVAGKAHLVKVHLVRHTLGRHPPSHMGPRPREGDSRSRKNP